MITAACLLILQCMYKYHNLFYLIVNVTVIIGFTTWRCCMINIILCTESEHVVILHNEYILNKTVSITELFAL